MLRRPDNRPTIHSEHRALVFKVQDNLASASEDSYFFEGFGPNDHTVKCFWAIF